MYCSSGVAYITKRYFTNKYIILLCLWICSTTIPQIEIYEDDSAADVLETIFEECDQQRFVFVLDEWDFIFHKDFVTEENKKQYVLFLSNLLKDRSYVQLTYMTGILPIAKYSSGSELNMFWEYTMASEAKYNEYFGFTQQEVDKILKDAGMEDKKAVIKEWYDGYQFGGCDVYCPWDVMNYFQDLKRNPDAKPISYWKNTSDNAIIRSFIDQSGSTISKKLEMLMAGESIDQQIEENLTYDYLHSSEENFWSILYLTGYLTQDKVNNSGETMSLKIPNKEIKEIFETTVKNWFNDQTQMIDRKALFAAVWNGDSKTLTAQISKLLRMTISYHDYKEDFYHAFLAGIFAGAGYNVQSNKGHGEGRSDIVIINEYEGKVAVFEVKCSKKAKELEQDCEKAIQQIKEKMYAKEYEDEYEEVFCYGISFYRKRCMVVM